MSPADTIEKAAVVEFFNVERPGESCFIARDPNYDKLENKALAQDKYAHFRYGFFATDDPVIIEALNSDHWRAKGVRCKSNPADMAEYGSAEDRKTWMNEEIERQVQERLADERASAAHSAASPFLPTPGEDAITRSPSDTGE